MDIYTLREPLYLPKHLNNKQLWHKQDDVSLRNVESDKMFNVINTWKMRV